jgi:gamma-glutamyl:cysteine ligase YbdK (ATP-grasp superfamily)
MTLQVPSFTAGIEEEYLLVNLQTLDLEYDPPTSLLEECRDICHQKEQVARELLCSQIEVGTRKSDNIHEAREDLVRLRRLVTEVSASNGLAPIAEDAIALDCVAEVEQVRVIMQRDTSANRQLSCYEDAVNSGANKQEALREVVKMLINLTQQA